MTMLLCLSHDACKGHHLDRRCMERGCKLAMHNKCCLSSIRQTHQNSLYTVMKGADPRFTWYKLSTLKLCRKHGKPTQGAKASGKSPSDFSSQGLHGGDIHHLEVLLLNDPVPHVLPHLMQHGKHGNVGLASAGGGTHQQVLVAVECCGVDAALNAVQGPAACKKKVLWPQLCISDYLLCTNQQNNSTYEESYMWVGEGGGGGTGANPFI